MALFWRSPPAEPERRAAFRMPYPSYRVADSYAEIDLSAAESSLQSIAVRASVDLIASLCSELPLQVFRGLGPGRAEIQAPGYLLDPGGDGHGLADWCYQALISWLLRGNLYGDILDQTSTGIMRQVMLHHPDTVSGRMESGRVLWYVNGSQVDEDEFVHRRVNPVPGQVLGLSPVAFHAHQIGLSLRALRFGEDFFRSGAAPTGLLTNEEAELDETDARTIKDRFLAVVRGSREPVVMGRGWKFQALQVSPEESQFLATQGFTEAQCARMFGSGVAEILGYETGSALTYQTLDGRMTHLLVLSVNRWLLRLERVLSAFLPRPQYAQFDRDAILQSTTLDRFKAHALAIGSQWKTPNEVRADEDMPPVAWGDEPAQAKPSAESGNEDDKKEGGDE
jgi:HK97 family phage portal protein